MTFSKFTQSVRAVFQPPFGGLGVVVWCYYVLCNLLRPDTPLRRGEFLDPDDTMLLAGVLDWVKGQGWYDYRQYRLDPPEGVLSHFSRLIDAPLGAMTLLFHGLGVDWVPASTMAAALWPLLLLALLLLMLRWLAESFLPATWTQATAFVALFSLPLLNQFFPGHVDHHGAAALITGAAFACLARLQLAPQQIQWAAGAGFFLALGQAVALETLVWLVVFTIWIGFWAMIKGREAARALRVFGLTLFAASAAFLALTVQPALWFQADGARFSIVYVVLTLGIVLCTTGVSLALAGRGARWRYPIGFGLAFMAGAGFLSLFPHMIHGPLGDVDPRLVKILMENTTEATPLIKFAPTLGAAVVYLFLPLMGLIACLGFLLNREEREKIWVWGLTLVLLATALLLTLFGYKRAEYYAFLFAVVPLTALLRAFLLGVTQRRSGISRLALQIAVLLLLGPLPSVILPALAGGRPFREGVLLFPAMSGNDPSCSMDGLEYVLNAPKYYGDRSRVVMNTMNEGAELLYKTGHKILSAPYHTNVRGNLEAVRFFTTPDPGEARKIAQELHVELVVLRRKSGALPPCDGVREDPGFAAQLADGDVPSWLNRLEEPALLGNYLLFEVRDDPATPHP